MKKIYIFTAVLALLTLSLNAQVANSAQKYKANNKAQISGQDKGQPAQSNGAMRAPNRYNAADGEFLVGPYTTDDYSTTGKGLYTYDFDYSYGRTEVSTVIPRSEIEQYIGQEIVGYRFATVGGTTSCYSFLVEIEGPNLYIDDLYTWNLQSSGSYVDLSGNQWHEYYLNEPVVFQIPDTTQAIWIGYQYYQERSASGNYTTTPIAVNPNVTSYECYAYNYSNEAFYDVTSHLGGAVAAQLIFKNTVEKTPSPTINMVDNGNGTYTITATGNGNVTLTIGNQTETGTGSASITIAQGNADQTVTATATAQDGELAVSNPTTENFTIPALPKTDTPVITYEVTDNSVIITATGKGTVNLSVGGQTASGDGSATITITRTPDEQTLTATATAQETGKQVSDPATENITIPEVGRSPKPTITMKDNGDGTYTITVTGTGEIAVYINDAEHGSDPIATANNTFSFNVEEHSQAMSITVQATNQEEGLIISRTAEETFSIPAMTIGSDFKELDPQPANASAPIDMSKLMFVDRFGVVIPNENNHPRVYDYTLEEAQVRQRSSNSVEVPVKHTGSDGLGYYTLEQIDDDTDAKLKMNVRNAAIELPLENDPGIYFYTAERSTAAYPDQADRKYFGVLQRTSDGNYAETLNPSYDWQKEYPGGQHHIHLDVDTVVGQYNDYLTYVPVVWTMGFDRVLYPTDHEHNSYGAPKWKTGVAQVEMDSHETPPVAERQTNKDNSVNWTAEGGPASLYILDNVVATATMPTVNTMPYEPYMFRIFVKSNNGKLRKYKTVAADPTNTTQPGEHLVGVTTSEAESKGPWCVWSGYVDDPNNAQKGVEITEGGGENGNPQTITFKKMKVDREYTDNGNPLSNWDLNEENAMFGALDALATDGDMINANDLTIYVRFYYIVKGSAEGHEPWTFARTAPGKGDPAGYGAEAPGRAPGQATAVNEITYQGEVVETLYYNVQGMVSDKPFDGVNIVVTRFGNGTTSVSKIVR